MTTQHNVKKLPCGHLYHSACLREVVERARVSHTTPEFVLLPGAESGFSHINSRFSFFCSQLNWRSVLCVGLLC